MKSQFKTAVSHPKDSGETQNYYNNHYNKNINKIKKKSFN